MSASNSRKKQNENDKQSLRDKINQTVRDICNQEAKILNVTPTSNFISSLADLVYEHVETTGSLLEDFAHHAKRNTIAMEDVKLLARRNEDLETLINDFAENLEKQNVKSRAKSSRSVKAKGNSDRQQSCGESTEDVDQYDEPRIFKFSYNKYDQLS
ncbi:9051_t:CDS:2 [Acaulospora colombiana]|uniref:9051_t:CDS:1 n=1 Tax=Acaulospora colombiana TaxID=27376 RepID=A0ACA9KRW3_9GLOM|nr:9051_t:CDS:2 [Acaulospora colombiana]